MRTARRSSPARPRPTASRALASLDALEPLDASVTLTGHGEPWAKSVAAAVEQARDAGPT
jgi:hypothetical protein